MFYICIQTKFYIKTLTFVFRQSFISKHLPLYSDKVLYQNIYLCIQTMFIFEHKGKCFGIKHLCLYSNKVLDQNIYLYIQTKFYIKTFTFVFRQCLYLNTKVNVLV